MDDEISKKGFFARHERQEALEEIIKEEYKTTHSTLWKKQKHYAKEILKQAGIPLISAVALGYLRQGYEGIFEGARTAGYCFTPLVALITLPEAAVGFSTTSEEYVKSGINTTYNLCKTFENAGIRMFAGIGTMACMQLINLGMMAWYNNQGGNIDYNIVTGATAAWCVLMFLDAEHKMNRLKDKVEKKIKMTYNFG